jgi:hypothetical protein
MSTISPSQLCHKLRAAGFRTTPADCRETLEHWKTTGVVTEPIPGRYQLSAHGWTFAEWLVPIGEEKAA